MIHRDFENQKDLFIETLTSHRSAATLKGDTERERERTKREEKKRGR